MFDEIPEVIEKTAVAAAALHNEHPSDDTTRVLLGLGMLAGHIARLNNEIELLRRELAKVKGN